MRLLCRPSLDPVLPEALKQEVVHPANKDMAALDSNGLIDSCRSIWIRFFLGIGMILSLTALGANSKSPLNEFQIPIWKGQGNIQLADFRGRIVILDFFAYWCITCRPATKSLEQEVQQYYARKGGNPNGIGVELIGVNIESERPDLTAQYIQETGLKVVGQDPDGKLLKSMGGESLPFIVILDGTGANTEQNRWIIRYQSMGYEGAGEIRSVIDAIKQTEPDAAQRMLNADKRGLKDNFDPALNRIQLRQPSAQVQSDFAFEGMLSSDLALWDLMAGASLEQPSWTGRVRLGGSGIAADYVPGPDEFWARANSLAELRSTGQMEYRLRRPEHFTWLFSGGAYQGFSDYRSMWLNEYYRQKWSSFPEYKIADPWGANVAGGIRWEWLPSTGFLQAQAMYQCDEVAPGYTKIPFGPLVRRRAFLETISGQLNSEIALHRRIRMLNAIQVTATTERDIRFSLQNSLYCAIAEHWTLHPELASTWETPDFYSGSLGIAVDYDWASHWFLGLFARYYQDNGQPNQSLPESEASPPLKTIASGINLRWQGEKVGLKLMMGPYLSFYETSGSPPTTYPNLYRDRNWLYIQCAMDYRF